MGECLFPLARSAAETIVMLKTAALCKSRIYEWYAQKWRNVKWRLTPFRTLPMSRSDENIDKINALVRENHCRQSTLWNEWNIMEFNWKDFIWRFAHEKSRSQIYPSPSNRQVKGALTSGMFWAPKSAPGFLFSFPRLKRDMREKHFSILD